VSLRAGNNPTNLALRYPLSCRAAAAIAHGASFSAVTCCVLSLPQTAWPVLWTDLNRSESKQAPLHHYAPTGNGKIMRRPRADVRVETDSNERCRLDIRMPHDLADGLQTNSVSRHVPSSACPAAPHSRDFFRAFVL